MIDTKLVNQKLVAFQTELERLVSHSQNQMARQGMSQQALYEYQYMIGESQNLYMWAAVRRSELPRRLSSSAFLRLSEEVVAKNSTYALNEEINVQGRGNIEFNRLTLLMIDALKSCVRL